MVTLRPVVSDLTPLTYALGSDGRKPGCEAMTALEADLSTRFPELKSQKNNGCRYWLENCLWDVRHDLKTVPKANIVQLFTLAEKAGQGCLYDIADRCLLRFDRMGS